jgi:hypothetical protein
MEESTTDTNVIETYIMKNFVVRFKTCDEFVLVYSKPRLSAFSPPIRDYQDDDRLPVPFTAREWAYTLQYLDTGKIPEVVKDQAAVYKALEFLRIEEPTLKLLYEDRLRRLDTGKLPWE